MDLNISHVGQLLAAQCIGLYILGNVRTLCRCILPGVVVQHVLLPSICRARPVHAAECHHDLGRYARRRHWCKQLGLHFLHVRGAETTASGALIISLDSELWNITNIYVTSRRLRRKLNDFGYRPKLVRTRESGYEYTLQLCTRKQKTIIYAY